MTRVLLARHGETDHNRDRLLQGSTDIELNETGLEQAQALAERLADEDISAVYSSDLSRARRTAEQVAALHDLEPRTFSELRERSYGELEGEPHDARYDEIDHADELDTFRPEGGEHADDVKRRAFPVVDSLREEHPDETVVVVAHGWTNRALIMAALGADSGYGHRIKQGNTCLNELQYEDYRGWRLVRVNDTAHLN